MASSRSASRCLRAVAFEVRGAASSAGSLWADGSFLRPRYVCCHQDAQRGGRSSALATKPFEFQFHQRHRKFTTVTRASAPASMHHAVVEAIVEEVDQLLEESKSHWTRGEFAECAEKCGRAIEQLGGDEPSLELKRASGFRAASARVNRACALKALERHEEALDDCSEGLRLLERQGAHSRNQVMQVLDLLAELNLLVGHPAEAERYAKRALALKEQFPWRKASAAASWNLNGQAKVQQGDFESAAKFFRRALKLHVEASSDDTEIGGGGKLKTSEGHAVSMPTGAAVTLSNYAGLLREQRKYGEAVEMYAKAAELFEARLGPVSEPLGRTLVELGATHVVAGTGGPAAFEPLTRAMVILGEALGGDHPSVAAAAEWLAKCSALEVNLEEVGSKLPESHGAFRPCQIEQLLAQAKAEVRAVA